MPHEAPFRCNQALDASGLTSLDFALRSANDAILDCRRSGKHADRDPAVLLLLRHLASLAANTGGDDLELRAACFETVKALRRRPVLTTLALDGVAYNAERKKLFHAEARRALTALAYALGYERRDFDLRSNHGGAAVSGEVTLHSDEVYIQVSCDCRGGRVLFRRCRNRRDYCGDPNRFATIDELTNPTQLATRICRELRLPTPAVADLLAA
jgi:hypothetical protein